MLLFKNIVLSILSFLFLIVLIIFGAIAGFIVIPFIPLYITFIFIHTTFIFIYALITTAPSVLKELLDKYKRSS